MPNSAAGNRARTSLGRAGIRRTTPIKIRWLPLAKHGTEPPIVGKFCDFLFDDGISQGFLTVEVVIERSLGDFAGGEN